MGRVSCAGLVAPTPLARPGRIKHWQLPGEIVRYHFSNYALACLIYSDSCLMARRQGPGSDSANYEYINIIVS
jgi:hypothetical protein